MNIYVSHLSWGTSSEGLGNLFAQFGEVASANVITDRETGRSRGFGFVEMPDDDQARKAMEQLNGASFEGQTITVNKVSSPRGAAFGRFRRQPWRRLRRAAADGDSKRVRQRTIFGNFPLDPYERDGAYRLVFLFATHTATSDRRRKIADRGFGVFRKKAISCRHESDRAGKTQGAGRIGQIRRFVRVERRHAPQLSGRCGQHRRGGASATPSRPTDAASRC